jgi:YD repeat-containing protein
VKSKTCKTILASISITVVASLLPRSAPAATYEYDLRNRLIRVVYDETTSIEYTYDAVGNRTRRVSTLLADTSINGKVNFNDYAVLASRWLDDGCVYPEWCDRADIDWNTEVNIEDLAILAQLWLHDFGP